MVYFESRKGIIMAHFPYVLYDGQGRPELKDFVAERIGPLCVSSYAREMPRRISGKVMLYEDSAYKVRKLSACKMKVCFILPMAGIGFAMVCRRSGGDLNFIINVGYVSTDMDMVGVAEAGGGMEFTIRMFETVLKIAVDTEGYAVSDLGLVL